MICGDTNQLKAAIATIAIEETAMRTFDVGPDLIALSISTIL